jgi:hypothetical protein
MPFLNTHNNCIIEILNNDGFIPLINDDFWTFPIVSSGFSSVVLSTRND